eukprot:1353490-Amorphochlora_amoeboformis.AAC.2
MSTVLTARLEAVVARLEKIADSIAAGGSVGVSAPSAGDSKDSPKFVRAYQEFREGEAAAFIAAANAIPECAKLSIGDMAQTLYDGIGTCMQMAADCKKPDQATLMAKLKSVTELFPKAEKAAFKRGKAMNHATAFKEMLQMVNFLFVPKPRGFAEDSYTTPDTYLNKIRTAAKKMDGDEKAKQIKFADTAKALGIALKDYIKEYHAAAVSWKKDGGDAKSWTPGAGPASAGPGGPPPPPGLGPPPVITEADYKTSAKSSKPATGGMSAVFAQINKGSSQCESAEKGGATQAFKLKRVTKEMKKAMKKEPALKPKEKKAKAPKKKVKKVVKKDPSCEFRQGTWWVEHQ